ncbi:hypothetical protein GGF31_000325 [Allomyces arbusculus]|nr:hypothetical protein GGF31_000325 [Allomyces arbusculus]
MSDLDAVPTIEPAPTHAAAVKLALNDLLLESQLPVIDATANAMTDLSPAEEAAVLPAQVAGAGSRDAAASEDATLAFYRTADEETTLPCYAAEHADEDAPSSCADVMTELADQTLLFYADVPEEHGDADATLPFYHAGTSPALETRALDEDEQQRCAKASDEVPAEPVNATPTAPTVDAPASDADVSSDAAPLTAATLAYYADTSAAHAHLDQILLPGYATAGQDLFQTHVAGPSLAVDRAVTEPIETVEESETALDDAESAAHQDESVPMPVTLDRSASIDEDTVHGVEPSTPALAAATPIPPSAPATLDFYAHRGDVHDGEQILLPEYATHGEPLFASVIAVPRTAPTVTIPHPGIEHEDLTLAVYHHHHSADQTLPFYRYGHHDLTAASMAVSPTSNSSGEVIHVDEVASMDGSGTGSGGGSWQIVSDDEDKDGAEEPVEKGGDVGAREAGAVETSAVETETEVLAADVPNVVDREVAVESPAHDDAIQNEAPSQVFAVTEEPAHDEPKVVDRSVSVDSPAPKADAQDADEALPPQAPAPADEPSPTIAAETVQAENDDEPCPREAAVELVVAAIEPERDTEAEAVPPVEEIEPEGLAATIQATPEPVEEPAELAVPTTSADVISSNEFQDAPESTQESELAHIEEVEPALAPAVARDVAVQEPTLAADPTVKTTVFINTADQEGDIDITEGLPEPELVDAVRFEAIGATRSLLTQRRVVSTSTTDDHEHEADALHDDDNDDDEVGSIPADDEDDELLATSPEDDELPVAREPSAVDDLVTAMTTPTTPPSIQRLMHFAFAFLVVSMTVLGVMTYGMEGNVWVWFLVVVNVLLWYAVTQVAAFTNDTDAGTEDAPVDKDGVVGKSE